MLFAQLFDLCIFVVSVSSSSWCLGRAAVCDCGTPWTFLLPFIYLYFFYNNCTLIHSFNIPIYISFFLLDYILFFFSSFLSHSFCFLISFFLFFFFFFFFFLNHYKIHSNISCCKVSLKFFIHSFSLTYHFVCVLLTVCA